MIHLAMMKRSYNQKIAKITLKNDATKMLRRKTIAPIPILIQMALAEIFFIPKK